MKKRMNTIAVAIAGVVLGATAATAITASADEGATTTPECCCTPAPTDEPTEPSQSPSPSPTPTPDPTDPGTSG